MKNPTFRFTKIACAFAAGMMLHQGQLVLAGWTGAMSGTGYGQASVNVTASSEKVRIVNTPNMNGPSASIKSDFPNYAYGASLPAGSSLNTVAQVKGLPGYIWQAYTMGNNGDETDNHELDNRVNTAASEICASLLMTSSSSFDPQTKSGTIEINAIGDAGTAFWTRGFELVNGEVPPPNDPLTPEDEFKDFLKANGILRWDVAAAGPFVPSANNCSTVTILFTIATITDNLYFVSDGLAKSLPLINCPEDIVVPCGQPVVYPSLEDLDAGNGVFSLAYNPPLPPGGIFPLGVTPVTVTGTDANGCTAICAFNVINALDFNGFYRPIGTFNDGTCEAPVRTVKLGNNLPVKFDVSCGGLPVITGTPPTLVITKPIDACGSDLVEIGGGDFQLVGNEWHFNWDTGSGGVTTGSHKLTATLQDGTQKYVWVKLK